MHMYIYARLTPWVQNSFEFSPAMRSQGTPLNIVPYILALKIFIYLEILNVLSKMIYISIFVVLPRLH